jgi:hypothetical protein
MKRGNSLVGLLVAAAIVLLLMVVVMKGTNTFAVNGGVSQRKDGLGKTVPGMAFAATRDDVCRMHLHDLRMAIDLQHQTNDEAFPATLEDTKQGSEFYSCPIGHEPYNYNPETGEVKCVHLGHEKY